MNLKYNENFEEIKRKIFEDKKFTIRIPEDKEGNITLSFMDFLLIKLHKRIDDIEEILESLIKV